MELATNKKKNTRENTHRNSQNRGKKNNKNNILDRVLDTVLDILGLKRPIHKLGDFEQSLIGHYMFNYVLDILLIIFGVMFTIKSGYLKGSLLFFFVILTSVGFHTHSLLQLLGGQVRYLDGTCIYTEKKTGKILWQTIIGTSKASIQADDGVTYILPIKHNSNIKEGNIIRVYFPEGSTFEKDEDTVEIINPVYVSKLKNSAKIDATNTDSDENSHTPQI